MTPREIRFRAWDKKSKQMFQVYSLEFRKDGVWACLDWESRVTGLRENWLSPDRLELMQFTGLKDSQGKEIYEGDIVNCKWFSAESNWGDSTAIDVKNRQVVYHEELAAFGFPVCHDGSPKYPLENYENTLAQCGDFEVLGNVFENPDLLPQTK